MFFQLLKSFSHVKWQQHPPRVQLHLWDNSCFMSYTLTMRTLKQTLKICFSYTLTSSQHTTHLAWYCTVPTTRQSVLLQIYIINQRYFVQLYWTLTVCFPTRYAILAIEMTRTVAPPAPSSTVARYILSRSQLKPETLSSVGSLTQNHILGRGKCNPWSRTCTVRGVPTVYVKVQ